MSIAVEEYLSECDRILRKHGSIPLWTKSFDGLSSWERIQAANGRLNAMTKSASDIDREFQEMMNDAAVDAAFDELMVDAQFQSLLGS